MEKNKYRVIFDTNFFLNFLMTRKAAKIDDLVENQTLRIIFSAELLNELVTVTQREKFRIVFNDKDLQKLLSQLKILGSFVNVKTEVTACEDPKANFLLALAKDGRADYIVSADKDLLNLKNFENTRIIAPHDFLQMF